MLKTEVCNINSITVFSCRKGNRCTEFFFSIRITIGFCQHCHTALLFFFSFKIQQINRWETAWKKLSWSHQEQVRKFSLKFELIAQSGLMGQDSLFFLYGNLVSDIQPCSEGVVLRHSSRYTEVLDVCVFTLRNLITQRVTNAWLLLNIIPRDL